MRDLVAGPSPCCSVADPVTSLSDDDTSFDPKALDDANDHTLLAIGDASTDRRLTTWVGGPSPLPLTALDGLETSRGPSIKLPSPFPATRSKVACLAFRHRGWADRRDRTIRAVEAAGGSNARLERLRHCGDTAWVLASTTEHGRYRLAANRCRDRFCTPCATEHRNNVCRNLRTALQGRVLRLMTLTLKSRDIPLEHLLGILGESWRRLRGMLVAQHGLLGGVAFTEITLNPSTRLWHPHLHVIFEGQYIPHAWLKEAWLSITTDSFIVDVRPLKDADNAASYVAKYASKAISANVVNDKERFAEAVAALEGARMFATFGCWTKLALSRHPESAEGWMALRPLYLVLEDARHGDVASIAILRALSGDDADDPLTLFRDDTG